MRIAYPHGKQNYYGRHHHRPPHSARGLRKHRGGVALEPEHQTRSIAVTNTIPVHKLENELVPYPYGNLSIDSTYAHGWTADPVTVLDGFNKQESFLEWPHTQEGNDGTGQNVLWYYVPQKTGARLKVNHIADYVDADGSKHAVDMTLTVNSVAKTALATRFTQSSGLYSFSWATVGGSIDLTAALSTQDGTSLAGVKGTTGFADLDGDPNQPNKDGSEGVELVSGFDGAYVRSDAHLMQSGPNRWSGIIDENSKPADEHGLKHYVGATFTGPEFRFKYFAARLLGGNFQPIQSTVQYPLYYDMNGGTGGPHTK